MSCNCCGAEKFFDLKSAQKELKKYRKSGPNKVTKSLLRQLSMLDVQGKSLLDIGGGIGAIQWDFMERGAALSTDVDYSGGYLSVASDYSNEKGWSQQTNFKQGDFLDVSSEIVEHDCVTLDKVVCCYPDFNGLLSQALAKSKDYVGLTYPLSGPVAKLFAFFGRIYLRLTGNTFRPYVHPVQSIRDHITQNGFKEVSRSVTFPWHVEVYRRG